MIRLGLFCLLAFAIVIAPASAAIHVGNFVWEDTNRNGIQDSGEPGVAGVRVELWNASKTKLLHSATTNASGIYALSAPGPGDYRVRVIPLFSGDQFTLKDQGTNLVDSDINPSGLDRGFTDTFNLATNVISITTMDAGLISDPMRDHNIGDFVFRTDASGTQIGSSPLAEVNVDLLNTDGLVIQTTVSNSNGFYSFKATPGTYRLRFIAINGAVPTPQANAGGDDTADSDIDGSGLTEPFVIAAGQVRRDLDAGFVNRVALGNFVWNDLDGDGVQDSGEPGIAGVLVELWDGGKTKRHSSTLTNSSGIYTLLAPGPGTYRVFVLRSSPSDVFSPKDAGGTDTADSDVNTDATNFGFTDVISVPTNLLSRTTIDVGIRLSSGPRDVTPLRITGLQRSVRSNWDLTFTGPVGGTFVIESSENLATWKEVIAPFASTTNETTRTVSSPSLTIPHFWRVRRLR